MCCILNIGNCIWPTASQSELFAPIYLTNATATWTRKFIRHFENIYSTHRRRIKGNHKSVMNWSIQRSIDNFFFLHFVYICPPRQRSTCFGLFSFCVVRFCAGDAHRLELSIWPRFVWIHMPIHTRTHIWKLSNLLCRIARIWELVWF